MIHENILGTIGNTPVVKIHRLAPPGISLYVKCEAFNPLSSVKDRLDDRLSRLERSAPLGVFDDADRQAERSSRDRRSSRRPPATPESPSPWSAP